MAHLTRGPGRFVLGAALTALALLALPRPADAQATGAEPGLREAVGRLDIGTTGFCSGTLVAPDLVLTAAHCLIEPASGERVDPRSLTFRAGLGRDGAAAVRRGARAVLHPDYQIAAPGTRPLADFDAALVRLAAPIARPAPVATGPAGAALAMLSYAKGRADTLDRRPDCRVVEQRAGVLTLDCPAEHGASGAPVISRADGVPRIAAIVSGGATRDGRELTLGPTAAPALAALRRALATGEGVFPSRPGTPRRLAAGAPHAGDMSAKFVRPTP